MFDWPHSSGGSKQKTRPERALQIENPDPESFFQQSFVGNSSLLDLGFVNQLQNLSASRKVVSFFPHLQREFGRSSHGSLVTVNPLCIPLHSFFLLRTTAGVHVCQAHGA